MCATILVFSSVVPRLRFESHFANVPTKLKDFSFLVRVV